MKKAILLGLFLSSSVFADYYQIITYQEDKGLTMGFVDSMVNHTKGIKTLYCYTGHAEDACTEIKNFFDGPTFSPGNGAHFRVERKCTVIHNVDEREPDLVKANYSFTYDNGEQEVVERVIERCSTTSL